MKRRTFFKAMAAFSVLPVIGIAAPRDDTAYIQGLIDTGQAIPPGSYRITRPLSVTKAGTVIRGCYYRSAA